MHVDIGEILARFLIGGAIVSFFAVLAEMFRPKSFAGLFGAAPSIALATIGITIADPRQSLRRYRGALHDLRRDGISALCRMRKLDADSL